VCGVSDLKTAVELAVNRAQAQMNADSVNPGLLFVGFDLDYTEVTNVIEAHTALMALKLAAGEPWDACLRGLYAQGLLTGLLVGQLREEAKVA
jgi:hypothetical protein